MKQSNRTPEETELHQKQELLMQKQTVLAELELSLSTLQANLHSFEFEYYFKVGAKYVELDQLQAILDKLLASKLPFDINASKRAMDSKERAEKSAHDAEEFRDQTGRKPSKFEPTPELRSTYRELAKLLHPDLALDQIEKERRHGLMQQINQAYQSGDLNKLYQILEAERNNPESIKGDDVGSSLVRTIRKIAQIEKRVADLQTELHELQKTDLYILYETVNAETRKGNNLLEQLSVELNSRIAFLRDQIDQSNR